MNNKEEIKQYLDAQLCVSKENPIQIVRDDFEHLLNSAASCTLITVEGVMPDLMEQLRTELKTLQIKTALDMVVNVSYHSSSEISFDQLYDLLSIIREYASSLCRSNMNFQLILPLRDKYAIQNTITLLDDRKRSIIESPQVQTYYDFLINNQNDKNKVILWSQKVDLAQAI